MQRYAAALATPALQRERVGLDLACGRVVAEPVVVRHDYPDLPRSSMDGFALRSSSTPGTLRISGEVHIGAPQRDLATDAAMRISTGGVLPCGADAVLPVEAARVDGAMLHIGDAVSPGEFVVAAGSDMRVGETLLDAGRRIGAPELAVLAALGVVDVEVYRQPVVGVISCGDELLECSEVMSPGKVRDSNRYAIAGTLAALGVRARYYPIVRDVERSLASTLEHAIAECDGVVTSGGTSVGEQDFMRRAVDAVANPGTIVHGLRIRPGRPTLLASAGGKPVVGLPGNAASALFVLEAVAAPALATLTGAPARTCDKGVRMAAAVRGREGWTWFVPVRERDGVAHPLPIHSFAASLAARSSGYVEVGGDRHDIAAGDQATMRRFTSGGA